MESIIYTVTAENGSTQTYTVTVLTAPDSVTQLKIITSPQTINVNTASSVITVQTQNLAGESRDVGKTTILNFNSTSATGQFSDANSTACNDTTWNNIPFTLSMNSNWANKNFCYKDSVLGTPTITVSVDSLTSDSQTFIIN